MPILSTVVYTPLDPSYLQSQADQLSQKLFLEKIDFILGFAEGGLIPAYAVAIAAGKRFVGSYRVKLDLPNEVIFSEEHSCRPFILSTD